MRYRCLTGCCRDCPTGFPLADADGRAVCAGQTNRPKDQKTAIQEWRRCDRWNVVLCRRSSQRGAADHQTIAWRDDHRASSARRDGAAHGQLINLAGAGLVGWDGHQRRRDQHRLGRRGDRRVRRVDWFDQRICKVLPAQINLPLQRRGVG